MVTAAVLWTVVSMASSASALERMGSGDTLAGFGQLFVGLAAAFAALASWVNGRKAKENSASAKEHSAEAAENSAEAAKALGPANGTTVLELLHEIKGFEAYVHQRNHDVLNALARANSATPVLLKLCERLLDRLEKEERS